MNEWIFCQVKVKRLRGDATPDKAVKQVPQFNNIKSTQNWASKVISHGSNKFQCYSDDFFSLIKTWNHLNLIDAWRVLLKSNNIISVQFQFKWKK